MSGKYLYFVLYLVTGTEMSSLSFKDLRGQAGDWPQSWLLVTTVLCTASSLVIGRHRLTDDGELILMLYVFKYVYKNYLTEIKIFISCPTTDVSHFCSLATGYARIFSQKLTLFSSFYPKVKVE